MDAVSIARFFGLIAMLLAYFGINIPENVTEGVVAIVVFSWATWVAWKNNNITKKAVAREVKLKELEGK